MKYFITLIGFSLADLRRSKVRTFLTSLGILIGVLSVVLLIAFGIGLKNYIKGQFDSLGTNLVIVLPGKVVTSGGFRSGGGALGGAKFDDRDYQSLKRLKEVEKVAPVFLKTTGIDAGKDAELSDIYATTADIFSIRNLEVEYGKLFTSSDDSKSEKRAVIGPKLAEKLFGNSESAVGKTIRFVNQRYSVIGVLKAKGGGGFGGPDFDTFTYIPYKASYVYNTEKNFIAFYTKARSEQDIPALKAKLEETLLKRYKKDDFSVIEQTEILNVVTSIFSMLNSILIAIGSISLLVGGIGIMNIMYATVTERTKEIGIRRAIGATKFDILSLFITEATILSLFGGFLGLALAYIIVLLIQRFFPASINLLSVILAFGISSFIGIFFGAFPARRAANLSPIDAIRYE